MKRAIPFLVMTSLFFACNKTPDINNATMLDGDQIFDASLYNPKEYLVSAAIPNPTTQDLNTPVIIAAHGYSASTFEWDEFKEWTGDTSGFYLSQVLLGGHGRDYDSFKEASWRDWQSSIKTEYNKLVELGYKNISLLGSSTGCPLMLDMVDSGFFDDKTTPQNIFFIDPIVIPSNKLLTIIGIVGPMLGYSEIDPTPEEEGHWYHFRPQETLQQLQKLLTHVRKQLESGITLPVRTRMYVYKSEKDGSADPVSAVLLYKGIKTHSGKKINVTLIDSDLHVYTRLAGRESFSQKDKQNQLDTFNEIKLLTIADIDF